MLLKGFSVSSIKNLMLLNTKKARTPDKIGDKTQVVAMLETASQLTALKDNPIIEKPTMPPIIE